MFIVMSIRDRTKKQIIICQRPASNTKHAKHMFNAESKCSAQALQTILPLMTVSQAPNFFPYSSVVCSQLASTITYYNKLPCGTVLCLHPYLAQLGCTECLRLDTSCCGRACPPFSLLTPSQNMYIACGLSQLLELQTQPAVFHCLQGLARPGSMLCRDSSRNFIQYTAYLYQTNEIGLRYLRPKNMYQ